MIQAKLTMVLRAVAETRAEEPGAEDVMDRLAHRLISEAIPPTATAPSPDRTEHGPHQPARQALERLYADLVEQAQA